MRLLQAAIKNECPSSPHASRQYAPKLGCTPGYLEEDLMTHYEVSCASLN
jgi:hypothetical protein